jgi:hypothetical protein
MSPHLVPTLVLLRVMRVTYTGAGVPPLFPLTGTAKVRPGA